MKYTLILISIFIFGCAQINPLTGGLRDTTAPEIDSSRTYPLSGQTNFTGDKLEIKFKEYISLKNPSDNIIITPQLEEPPIIYAHNKKLTIELNNELLPNTTYTISFNHAVQDITEKNDSIFQFVFSTGDYIDSLSVEGRATDAFTNIPEKGFLVALYPVADSEVFFDSIPYKLKPTYIGQTNAKGEFKLNYLKEGIYYLFVYDDQNRNLLLDEDEKLGFLNEETVSAGSPGERQEIRTFDQDESSEVKLLSTRFGYPGKLEFIFSGPVESNEFGVKTSMPLLQANTDSKDSLVFWLESNPTSKMRFHIDLNGVKDTLKPLYKGVPDRGAESVLNTDNNVSKGFLLPGENLQLEFFVPINDLNKSGVHFYDIDSVNIDIDWEIEDLRKINFETFGTQARRIVIDSAAIQTIYGNINESKIQIIFDNKDSSYFGSFKMNIDTLYERPVFVELINDKGEVVEIVAYSQNLNFEYLLPGKYQLRLIFDDDEDMEWTTGSLKKKRQAERVIYYTGEILIKSKWEKEIDWSLKTTTNGDI